MSASTAATSPQTAAASLTEQELLGRIEEMVPRLKARAEETEKLRQLPQATIDEAWASGFLSAFRPRYWGGSGLGLSALANGARILAHGCGSSAWTLVFLAQHVWMFGKAHYELQKELLGGERPGMMAGALARLGTAEPTEGGYLVTARSDWNSAVMHADWVNFKVDIDGVVYMAVLPKSSVTVEDVWHTSGLRGTGSNTIWAEKAFVPTSRLLKHEDFLGTKAEPIHDDEPFVSYPFAPVVMTTISGVALGLAEAAVAELEAIMQKRVLAFSGGAKMIDQQVAHMRMGEAGMTLRILQMLWHDSLNKIVAAYEPRKGMDVAERVAIKQNATYIATSSARLVAQIMTSTGGSAFFTSCPLQRIRRDIDILSCHAILDWDRGMQMAGKVTLGLPLAPTDLY